MIASLQLADVGRGRALTALRTRPDPGSVPGLRWAAPMITAPLTRSIVIRPNRRRIGLLAFWDNEQALDAFLSSAAAASIPSGGWQVRLAPVRATGDWPGLTDEPVSGPIDGPAVTVTLGRLRLSQTGRFLRASARAQGAALDAPGLVWGTLLARPPLVATCTVWQSAAALAAYAYRTRGHAEAVTSHEQKPFHHRSAFIRFRPYGSTGDLDGRDPLTPAAHAAPAGPRPGPARR